MEHSAPDICSDTSSSWAWFAAAYLEPSPYIGRVHRVVGLAGYFVWDLVRANLRLALDVATPRYNMKPGILAVPLDATKDSEILLLAMLINLTPGSVALDVSPDRKVMYVHVMYIEHAGSGAAGD